MDKIKLTICTGAGFVASALGGWDKLLQVFCVVLAIEMVTGLLKAFTGKSDKSESGFFNSTAFRKGVVNKIGMFLLIILATQVGGLIFPGETFARNSCLYALIFMELSSIVENLGLLGVPIPSIFTKILEVLKKKETEGIEDKIADVIKDKEEN